MDDLFDLTRPGRAWSPAATAASASAWPTPWPRHGADVAIWGTNEDKNAAAAEQLAATADKVLALRCDVGDQDAGRGGHGRRPSPSWARSTAASPTPASAGGPQLPAMTADEWRRVLRVNLDGAFFTLQAAVRHMVERGERREPRGDDLGLGLPGPAEGRALRRSKAGGGRAGQGHRGRARPRTASGATPSSRAGSRRT